MLAWENESVKLGSPIVGGEAVDISTTDHACSKTCRWVAATGSGIVKVLTLDGSELALPIPANGMIKVLFTSVYKTGTTATGIVAGW